MKLATIGYERATQADLIARLKAAGHTYELDGALWFRATDFGDWLCQPTRCWPVTSTHVLRYRDGHHLTNTFAIAMAPAMYSRLRWLMR